MFPFRSKGKTKRAFAVFMSMVTIFAGMPSASYAIEKSFFAEESGPDLEILEINEYGGGDLAENEYVIEFPKEEDAGGVLFFSECFNDGAALQVSEEELYWSAFSGTYFYDEVLNENEKAFYDALYEQGMELLLGDADVKERKDANGNACYYVDLIPAEDLSKAEATRITQIFRYENPQFFFFSNSWMSSTNSKTGVNYRAWQLYPAFVKGSDRQAAVKEVKSAIEGIYTEIKDASINNAFDKEVYVHDFIKNRMKYSKSTYDQSAYSVLSANSTYTVCAGYAQSFELLMNGLGIDTVAVSGGYGSSKAHEWNKVKLYGNWHIVDVTWDDQRSDYSYFNRSDAAVDTLDTGGSTYNVTVGGRDYSLRNFSHNEMCKTVSYTDSDTIFLWPEDTPEASLDSGGRKDVMPLSFEKNDASVNVVINRDIEYDGTLKELGYVTADGYEVTYCTDNENGAYDASGNRAVSEGWHRVFYRLSSESSIKEDYFDASINGARGKEEEESSVSPSTVPTGIPTPTPVPGEDIKPTQVPTPAPEGPTSAPAPTATPTPSSAPVPSAVPEDEKKDIPSVDEIKKSMTVKKIDFLNVKGSETLNTGDDIVTLRADGDYVREWLISNEDIAEKVSSSGSYISFRAVKPGTFTVTACSGTKTKSVKYTVLQSVRSVTASGSTVSLNKGESIRLCFSPDRISTDTFKWSVDKANKKYVSVGTYTGIVKAKMKTEGPVAVTISAYAKDGTCTASDIVYVNVYDGLQDKTGPAALKFSLIDDKDIMTVGSMDILTAEYENAGVRAAKPVKYKASGAIKIDKYGRVTAKKAGEGYVWAECAGISTADRKKIHITVKEPLKSLKVNKTVIKVKAPDKESTKAKTVTFTAKGNPAFNKLYRAGLSDGSFAQWSVYDGSGKSPVYEETSSKQTNEAALNAKGRFVIPYGADECLAMLTVYDAATEETHHLYCLIDVVN